MKKNIAFLILAVLAFTACKRDKGIDYNPNIALNFSTDSILFDTVFTTLGTTTRSFKVFNTSKNNIEISNIRLVGGATSAFKININGVAQPSVSNVRVNANDSIYVFVKAVIDPTDAATPFLVQDTLEFLTNGNLQKIPVVAFGQNAVYLNAKTITTDFTFTKTLPYIIYNTLTIAQNVTAQINAGAKLFFHSGAQMNVYGTLKANGLATDTITFCSDRTERIYRDEAGQWKGVHFFNTSSDNTLNYCTVKNALVGLQVDEVSSNLNPKLLITNSTIKNHTIAGLLAHTAHVVGINNLFYNCGKHLLVCLLGGNYNFYQNTFFNDNYNFIRNSPAVFFSDNLEDGSNTYEDFNLDFTNNIVWGSLDNEFLTNQKGSNIYTSMVLHNVLKSNKLFNNADNNILNLDPSFEDTRKDNFKLTQGSPAENHGTNLSANLYFNSFISKDLKGVVRTFPSDLGCLEIK